MQRLSANVGPGNTANRYITEEQYLKTIARQFMEDYPDIHSLAYAEARALIFRHTGRWLNPDRIYWHRFSGAVSSPRTFTGWQHSGQPVESMTFVELMIHRFNATDQVAPDELQVYGGFYSDGPQHDRFDERNEIALLPQQVLDDFWSLDFSSAFMTRMANFWDRHSEHFCILARAGFLASAGLQLRSGGLSLVQFAIITEAIIGKLQPVMTLDTLSNSVIPGPGLTLRTFDIGGYVCPESIRIVANNGQQFLYLPGSARAFHVFASEQELYAWVQGCLGTASSKSIFKSLFLRSATARQLHDGFLDDHFQQVLDTPWAQGQTLVNQNDRVITGDVFVYLRGIARQQMQEDAQTLLTSNTSLRKRIWIGYLSAFINVFGALAPLGWPITLTLVGAGVANLALNFDQAIHDRDPRQRKAGILGVIVNTIFVAFNLSMLVGLVRAGSRLVGVSSSGLPAVSSESIALTELNPVSGAGRMRGIQMLTNGETWISLDDLPHRVVFSDAHESWIIDGPVGSGDSGRAVFLDGDGQWKWREPLPMQPLPGTGLPDETQPLSFVTIRSTFWDAFMQFNLTQEEQLSQIGLVRQRLTMNIPEAAPNGQIISMGEDMDIYIDEGGDVHHVFKKADGQYVGGRISMYSVMDSSFNEFLRSGVSHGPTQVELIEELADDLLAVGVNNNVTLYRGGSALRGTSGRYFRSGRIRAGDVLVSTDMMSFSENPYIARAFCSSQAGENSASFAASGASLTFDESSVVFELPARHYFGATPIAPFSREYEEVESLLMPGRYFLIDGVQEVSGLNYRFLKVQLSEIPRPKIWHRLYELRTGEPFSRESYAARLGEAGRRLVDRFFPVYPGGLSF
ncbi:hypothetical protein ALQ04_04435 [Pseudomonas cichorii]|uniref:Dermonecrotic toxin N-terminal domain-containing protein n=1 Tax=Pseudomonas cichorii TaxID=36746 RepID=A0A3M4LYK5_PSECI|nr:DUF6543 domain-containing protein [Pseudomonas cichorii]RMQ46527.1 hypothetical protein ALQ04_04435 [Pseudomonas cichorii]